MKTYIYWNSTTKKFPENKRIKKGVDAQLTRRPQINIELQQVGIHSIETVN